MFFSEYYGIDSSYEAEIPQEILEEQQQVLEKGREDFENLREEINSIILVTIKTNCA